MSTLLFEANADTEDVPDMSIREPVSTNMKCGPIGQKSMVLTNPPGAQVCRMVAPDATGDSNDDTGFYSPTTSRGMNSQQRKQVSQQPQFRGCIHLSKHGPCDRETIECRTSRDFRMPIFPTSLGWGRNHTSEVQPA